LDLTLREWGWKKIDEDQLDTGAGILDLASDGLAATKLAAMRAWSQQLWAEEPRASDLATTAKRSTHEPYVGFQKDLFKNSDYESIGLQCFALGAGIDGASLSRIRGHEVLCEECSAGVVPTRRHLTFHCAGRGPYPPTAPSCGGEEGLCVPLIAKRTAARARSFQPDADLMDMMRRWSPDADGRYLAATDGGADGRCGETRIASWGAALKGVETSACNYVPGLDQSSTAAETWALLQLMIALDAVAREKQMDRWPCFVLIDNKTVQRRLAQAVLAPSPPQAWRLWNIIHGIAGRLGVQSRWVPSHGKQQDWQPLPAEGDAADWRALNEAADEAASKALLLRVRNHRKRLLDKLRERFPRD